MRPALFALCFALGSLAGPALAQDPCPFALDAVAERARSGRPLSGDDIGETLDACGTDGPSRLVRALAAGGDCDLAAQVGRSLEGHTGMPEAVAEADACFAGQIRAGLDDLDVAAREAEEAEPFGDGGRGPVSQRPAADLDALGSRGSGYGGGGARRGDFGGTPSARGQTRGGLLGAEASSEPSASGGEKARRGRRASTGAGSYDPGPVAMRHGASAPIAAGEPVAWSSLDVSVWFDHDSAGLRPEALATLATVARSLRGLDEDAVLEVIGHTDSSGAWTYNVDLSLRRARSVRQALVLAGADPDRISVRGLGEDFPVASNGSWWGRARNRRVEFRFYKPVAIRVTR